MHRTKEIEGEVAKMHLCFTSRKLRASQGMMSDSYAEISFHEQTQKFLHYTLHRYHSSAVMSLII